MRLAPIALAGLLAAAGCATPPPAPKQPFPSFGTDAGAGAAAETPGAGGPGGPAERTTIETVDAATVDPVAYARKYPRPEFCEEAARRLQAQSRDKAWDVLKACVARGRFTLLARLVDGGWTDDLKTRPEASLLIAKVIATRGGDVGGDLGQLRRERIPLFPLGPALSHPDLYKGRLVLFRAEVRDVKIAAAKATARLGEFAVGVSEQYVGNDRLVGRHSRSYSSSDGPNAYGESSESWQRQKKFTKNEAVATGLEAIARMAQVDPFFEPGRQFVVLARFDGVRDEEGEQLDQVNRLALVSIVAYYEPNPSIVE